MSILFSGRATGAEANRPSWFRQLLMHLTTHIRQAVTSLGEIWRTPLWAFITIAVLGISLTFPVTLHLLVKNIRQVSDSYNQSFEISLFLQSTASEKEVATLVTLLQDNRDVASVRLIDKESAMQEFKQESGFGEALSFISENPLPHVLLVTPKINTPAAAQDLQERLQKERYVELAKLDISWLERLAALVALVQQAVYAIAVLLLSGALLVIGNTIRLLIMDKKTEIEVMKLVGATNSFIQRPYLYTGIWLGFFAGLLAFLIVELMLFWLEAALAKVTALYQSQFMFMSLTLQEFMTLLAVGVVLGFCGSYLAVRSHIQAIEPM